MDRLRRAFLGAVGSGVALSTVGATAASADDGGGASPPDGSRDRHPNPPVIDPAFGYPALPDEDVPTRLEPDHTVELHTNESLLDTDPNTKGAQIGLGAFHFDPVGIHVEPGDIVKFEGAHPEHNVTPYHLGMGRQQRVPSSVPPFASPSIAGGGYWLYRFEEPGVYDLFCTPHEQFGMVMRVVVGDEVETIVRSEDGRPPFGLAAKVFGKKALSPSHIVESGTVGWHHVFGDGHHA